MAGKGFYIDFKVPELQRAINNLSRYDGKTAMKIEEQIRVSTLAIKRGALRRIHDVTGYLRKHTVSSFSRNKLEGAVREKAPHAHLVEFGHKGPSPAPEHPTLRPAFEDERPNLVRGLEQAVKP
jgi:hypothetical protein